MHRHSGWKHFPKEEPSSPFDGAWNISAILFLVAFYGLFAVGLILWVATPSRGQLENHDLHHAQYQNWQSKIGFHCCNNKDYGELADKDVRDAGDHHEVRIDDQWCPVLEKHLLSVGKSPDWSRDHACILSSATGQPPCDRLKCFKGKVEF